MGKAEQAKLKAKADKEAAKAEKSKVEAKKKETQAAVKVAEEKAKAAKGSGDKTAVAAKADAAAAKVIEKTDINDIPGVSSLHTQSVTEIAKARFAQLIASGDITVPKNAKSAPIAADKAA